MDCIGHGGETKQRMIDALIIKHVQVTVLITHMPVFRALSVRLPILSVSDSRLVEEVGIELIMQNSSNRIYGCIQL